MPTFNIVRKATPAKSFRVASVMGTFDLETTAVVEHFVGSIDMPDKWQIGLIVGNSGTGKTTIARELFPDAYVTKYDYTHESFLDDMPAGASMTDITKTLNSVGLSSVPSWLKRYDVLSNGEKMRVDLARAILEERQLIVFDEFTSVVDRNIAKVGSYATQKAIRKTDKQFIAVTCHFDVEDWLLPDWVFDTNTMTFRTCEGQKKNRPKCELRIYEVKSVERKEYYWRIFRRYHYLSHAHNNAARVFVATLDGSLCAFLSYLHMPHPRVKNLKKTHRLVVLPDFQGLGIGVRMSNYIADYVTRQDFRFLTLTNNPAFIHNLNTSPNWRCIRFGRVQPGKGKIQNIAKKGSTSRARVTASFEYIGNTNK